MRRIAESATGRRVLAVLCQSSVAPALSTVVIVFEPESARGRDDERLGDALAQSSAGAWPRRDA